MEVNLLDKTIIVRDQEFFKCVLGKGKVWGGTYSPVETLQKVMWKGQHVMEREGSGCWKNSLGSQAARAQKQEDATGCWQEEQ